MADCGDERLAAVAKAQERASFSPTSQIRDMGYPRAAGGAAGGDGARVDELHRQTAGPESVVDYARELHRDGVCYGWLPGAFGDVQSDGIGEVAHGRGLPGCNIH